MTTHTDLEGVLKVLPSPRADLLEVVSEEYANLAGEYGARNVLVLKRHPSGLEYVRETLAQSDVGAAPRLESVPEHASKVLEEYDPTIERLEYEERIELISLVIAGASREIPPYLEGASEHEPFARDVGQLLLEATRQRIRLDDCGDDIHDCLAFLYAMNDRFHEVLDERGLIERSDVIPRVVELLATDADSLQSRVTDSFDAVLALEFEEFRQLDREYLSVLTQGSETALVCLGERHASVERTRVEPGRLEDLADGLEIEVLERTDVSQSQSAENTSPPHSAITHFLATGEDDTTDAQSARRIHAGTVREQLRSVAAEIQYLLGCHDWAHDDIAVAVPSIDRVPDARSGLRDAGVPTATIGTATLKEDPAVNELYAVVSINCDHDVDLASERLEARVPDFSPDLVAECTGASVSRSLERWIGRTHLKHRIASEEPWVDAAEQFQSIRQVLEIARFVETTDLVAPDWEGMRRMLRRTIKYDAPYVHSVDTQSSTGGVTVCAVSDLKYDSREAVFLLDLVDTNYPGETHLTQLFPTAWLASMTHFPAVTDPTPETVAQTFGPAPDPAKLRGDPLDAYHAQRARRELALGARAARSQLYWCTYERESDGLRRTHDQSRYLTLLETHPACSLEDVHALEREAAIHGEANALEALLDEPWRELERVLREASTGGEADLGETEALFEELQVVLERDIDDDLADAVRSQFEFAAGEVRRRD